MRPVALIVIMLGIIYTVKTFDTVILLTNGGPDNGTQLMSTWAYQLAFTNFQTGDGAAVARHGVHLLHDRWRRLHPGYTA